MKRIIYNFSLWELKCQKYYYLLLLAITTTILTATISTYAASVSIPNELKKNIEFIYPNGSSVIFQSDIDTILAITKTDSDFSSIAISNSLIEKGTINLNISGKATSNRLSNSTIITGEEFNSFDERKVILLSAELASLLEAEINDEIALTIFDYQYTLSVIGIYESSISTFLLPLALMKELNENSYQVIVGVNNVHDITKLTRTINNYGIDYIDITGAIDQVKSLQASQILFWSMTILLLLVGCFFVFNFINMIINSREKVYGLYKILGTKNSALAILSFTNILIVVLFASMISFFSANIVNEYYENLTYSLFDNRFTVDILWYMPLVVFFIYFIFITIIFFYTKKRFSNIDAKDFVTAED